MISMRKTDDCTSHHILPGGICQEECACEHANTINANASFMGLEECSAADPHQHLPPPSDWRRSQNQHPDIGCRSTLNMMIDLQSDARIPSGAAGATADAFWRSSPVGVAAACGKRTGGRKPAKERAPCRSSAIALMLIKSLVAK